MISGGTTASTTSASSAFIEVRITMAPTKVTSWTRASMKPLCSSDWSASMSEVMRVMIRPVISRS